MLFSLLLSLTLLCVPSTVLYTGACHAFISSGPQNPGLAVSPATHRTFAIMICSACHVPKERTNTTAPSKSRDWDSEGEGARSQDTVLESSSKMYNLTKKLRVIHKNLNIRQHWMSICKK